MEKMITIVGCGPGAADYVTPIVRDEVHHAEIFVAAPHLHNLFPDVAGQRIMVGTDIDAVLQTIELNREKKVVIGVSGDPGIASLAHNVIERFGKNRCRVIPGISSITVAFARLGRDWTNARIVNAHRGVPPNDPTLENATLIALLAGAGTVLWVKEYCSMNTSIKKIYICENLTLPDEHIRVVTDPHSLPRDLSSRTVLILTKED